MVSLLRKIALLSLGLLAAACTRPALHAQNTRPILGLERTAEYLPLLKGKRVGLVVNHTTIFPNGTHLADSLISMGVTVKTIFAPEHGFRGTATDGEEIVNGVDTRTGVPIQSLYGSNRKPSPEQLKDLDVLIFDIQDVGTRFYTYTSTMHYVLEAGAEQGKPVVILDRPNPNGHFVDGPVLEPAQASFIGLNPVPIAHGCTVGELARMIVGEGWLKGGVKPTLHVIECRNYTHQTPYTLPVAPSPNLPNQQSIMLYPSICLLEPTIVSVGRGTDSQFQVIGGPDPALGSYTFTPVDKPGALNPPQEGKLCYGLDLRNATVPRDRLTLQYVIDFYRKATDKSKFFTSAAYFDRLAGTPKLREQLIAGATEAQMRASWQPGLEAYKTVRAKYLIYK